MHDAGSRWQPVCVTLECSPQTISQVLLHKNLQLMHTPEYAGTARIVQLELPGCLGASLQFQANRAGQIRDCSCS